MYNGYLPFLSGKKLELLVHLFMYFLMFALIFFLYHLLLFSLERLYGGVKCVDSRTGLLGFKFQLLAY